MSEAKFNPEILSGIEPEIYEGSLDADAILSRWYAKFKNANCGAFITFVGIVREEGGICALSFDIYEPILRTWFEAWQQKAAAQGAFVLFAHANGGVPIHESSYVAGVVSPQRKVALALINEFVEDFKAAAPIWKYDVKGGKIEGGKVVGGKRIYAADRSQRVKGAGLLG